MLHLDSTKLSALTAVAFIGLTACTSSDDPNKTGPGTTPGSGDGEISGGTSVGSGAGGSGGSSSPPIGGSGGASSESGGDSASGGSASGGSPGPGIMPDGGIPDGGVPDAAPPVYPSPGTLTAGVWDDNQNFDQFSGYRAEFASATVSDDPQTPIALPVTDAEHAAAHAKFNGPRPARQKLDIALIIDTTGSMGDEISYLQSEFIALSNKIQNRYPDAEQRWALAVYRDNSDDYVVRWFDFRSDPEAFRTKLAAQSAGGGGDFPEASHAGLQAMNGFTWREGADVARLAFWVADAPHHTRHTDELVSQINMAQQKGIRIYPVASSGVDERTEYAMRSAAQLTGGRYLFLTDDSGVGGVHKEPTLPCYFVTLLDAAILRMVDIEMTGTYREPTANETIRVGGDPQNGACKLDSGQSVEIF